MIGAFFIFVPTQVLAYGYGCAYGYGEGQYYGQSTYYAQGSYAIEVSSPTLVDSALSVLKSISKGSGTFVIDHPLDPANKLLYHSFVESPDVKNMYDGVVVLDKKGEAIVRLPAYFDALNTDVRYQLKPIGTPMPDLHVKEEEKNNQFAIGGGKPGGKVSWQITGTRRDPYIIANPIIPEVEKGPGQPVERGEYLYDVSKESVSRFAPFLNMLKGLFGGLFGIQ